MQSNPDYWRRYAEKARAMVANLASEESRQTMIRVAESYDRLADQAELRAKRE